jgi:ketopantoate reductase
MRFIVVGAGAVGAVIGGLLEAAGHEVAYWVRAERREQLRALELQRLGGALVQTREPTCVSRETALPACDWLLVCVRTEQLTAALSELGARVAASQAIAVATVTLDGAVASARQAGFTGPVLALHVSFGSCFVQPTRVEWFPFSLPSTVSTENQPQLLAAARELARQLETAGLPTQSVLSMSDSMRWMVGANIALLPAWELCGWDVRRLAASGELRHLAAAAMQESAQLLAAPSGIVGWLARHVPARLYAWLIWWLPLLMGARASKLWQHHGPKTREQTRHVLADMRERAKRAGVAAVALEELQGRWLVESHETAPPTA